MKEAFYKIPPVKRERIITNSIEEFAEWGYEKGSTDRIIARCGISKGGLYEYISSKEELFLFVVDHTYGLLYDYIIENITAGGKSIPADVLDRFSLVSSTAIDFYIDNPALIKLIVKTNHVVDLDIAAKVHAIFINRFRGVFGDADESRLAHSGARILELMEWLLLKTRNDFMENFIRGKNTKTIRRDYLREWDFIISVMKNGIYKKVKGG